MAVGRFSFATGGPFYVEPQRALHAGRNGGMSARDARNR